MATTTTATGEGPGAPTGGTAGDQASQPAGQAPTGQTQTETNPITDERARGIESLDRALELLAETRREAADNRRQLRQLQQAQQQAQQAGQTEAQRLQQQLEATQAERDRLLQTARAGVVSEAARSEATALHAVNPVVIARMVEYGDVSWDATDPDKPTNIRELVRRIRDDFPDYFRAGDANGGTPGKPAKADMNQLIRGAAGRG